MSKESIMLAVSQLVSNTTQILGYLHFDILKKLKFTSQHNWYFCVLAHALSTDNIFKY